MDYVKLIKEKNQGKKKPNKVSSYVDLVERVINKRPLVEYTTDDYTFDSVELFGECTIGDIKLMADKETRNQVVNKLNKNYVNFLKKVTSEDLKVFSELFGVAIKDAAELNLAMLTKINEVSIKFSFTTTGEYRSATMDNPPEAPEVDDVKAAEITFTVNNEHSLQYFLDKGYGDDDGVEFSDGEQITVTTIPPALAGWMYEIADNLDQSEWINSFSDGDDY